MTKTAERVLRRAAYTPVFLLHNVPVVAAAAALVGQLVAYQHGTCLLGLCFVLCRREWMDDMHGD